MKRIILSILLIPFFYLFCFSQKAIYNNDFPEQDTIFIDIVKVNESSRTFFTLKNLQSLNIQKLKIGKALPSFYFGETPGHPFEWEEFSKTYLTGELFDGDIEISQDSSFTFKVTYFADPRLPQYPLGLKRMRLILGLFDPSKPPPIDDKSLVAVDTFLLMAKKTYHWVDAYFVVHNFDSVYINTKFPPKFLWKLKNIHSETETITSYQFKDSSDRNEFTITKPEVPIEIRPKSPRSVIEFTGITYKPKNRGRDSANISIKYAPIPPEIADSIPMPSINIYGIGVEQEINLIDAIDLPILKKTMPDTTGYTDSIVVYTIDAGKVRIGFSKIINGIIRNDGNLRFGIKNQAIYNQFDDNPAEYITISKPLGTYHFHLLPNLLDTFRLNFTPQKMGDYFFRYTIESDIIDRKIYGISPYARKVVFNIIAKGVSPKYSISKDTFDLGKVFIGCPPERTEIVYINNTGNEPLVVTPYVEYPSIFTVEPSELIIPSLSNSSFTFTYKLDKIGAFQQTITLKTNENSPNNQYNLFFIGEGIPLRNTQMTIPHIKSQPGRIINIPILVDREVINLSNQYTDTLIYDPSLLSFLGIDYLNTATEGSQISENTKITDNRNGKLFIHLEMPIKEQYFRSRDTLVKFQFRTYLGNKISSPISITSPLFSDYLCEKVLNIDPNFDIFNGSFTLDSVCGLQLKAYDRSDFRFSLISVNPVPAMDYITIEFENAYQTDVNLAIFNNYGSKVSNLLINSLPAGLYKQNLYIGSLAPGVYYIEMKAGIFYDKVKIIINR